MIHKTQKFNGKMFFTLNKIETKVTERSLEERVSIHP